MTILNIFANQAGQIPLSELDTNFATPITIGTTPIVLGQTAGTITGLTLVGANLGTPTGNLVNCTFPTLNQNTTGTAYSVTGLVLIGNGGTGVTTSTGSGSNVLNTSPNLVTPLLGTPTSGTLTTCTGLPLTTGITGILPVLNGGTGVTTPAIVAGTGIGVSGTWPNQTIASTAAGTVTSVGTTGSVNGITLTGTVTTSGNLTLGGTLSGVALTSQVTGVLPIANGGTGGTVGGVMPIQPITASVGASALTCTLNPTILNFRNTPLTSGTINTVNISSAISVTVPSGALMATVSAQQSRLVLVALYNGGNPVLGVTSNVGGENPDETTLATSTAIATTCTFTGAIAVTTGILTLSATGTGTLALGMSITGTGVPSGTYVKALLTGTLGAAGSTYSTNITTAVASTTISGSAGIGVYTTAAVTASPFRVVGYVESTQATAGTWATSPSTIQGQGGQALAAMSSLGYGQTWQSVTRTAATTYYNTTGKPITLIVSIGNTQAIVLTVGAYTFPSTGTYSTDTSSITYIIPPYAKYSYTGAISDAQELR